MNGKKQAKPSPVKRDKIIHISSQVHKKLKIFCAELDLDLGPTAEKAIDSYIKKAS